VPVQDYHTPEQYEEAFEALNGIAGAMLFEFNQHGEGHRDTIIRNFIARSLMMGRAVFKLYRLEDYHDCWILHRCLLDRLFHLEASREEQRVCRLRGVVFLAAIHVGRGSTRRP
jgi:hypothetical protein